MIKLTPERIEELWVEHGLDECYPEGFARAIEAEVLRLNGGGVEAANNLREAWNDYTGAEPSESRLGQAIDDAIAMLQAAPQPVRELSDDLLETIDNKAQAGLCQMTHAGTREFLKDIRAILSAQKGVE